MAASMCRRAFPLAREFSRFTLQNARQSTRRTYSTLEAGTEKQVKVPEANYPPIVPPLFARTPETKEYKTKLIIEGINAQPTATDMIYELSKRQSWHYNIFPKCFHYSFSNLYQHCTKTVMVEELPKQTLELANSPSVEKAAEMLKPHVMDCILEQVHVYRHKIDPAKKDRIAGRQTMENITRVLLAGLAADFPHLRDSQVDQDVVVKSFWKRDETKFQFTGNPLFLIRTKEPLPEFISRHDEELSVGEVPSWSYAPENVSVFKQHINPNCFPGFKIGNPFTHGHTQIYMSDLNRRKCMEDQTLEEVLMGIGMSSSFGWLNGLALYHMYNPYRDVTKPMSCQTIVTDGRNFSFFCYQLNTLGLCSRSADNPLRNVCWYTPETKLYGDTQDGRVVDFNDEVLKQMIAFLLNSTTPLEE